MAPTLLPREAGQQAQQRAQQPPAPAGYHRERTRRVSTCR
jgi:hypothetical protein